jgi:uncharacterized protein
MAPLPFVPGRHAIEAYGGGGFRFAGMSHVGSILATPRGISGLAAASIAEVGDGALAPLIAELEESPGAVELLVLGTGAPPARLPEALIQRLRASGLRFETMATGPAARVYNVLVDEGRRVAALLIAVA